MNPEANRFFKNLEKRSLVSSQSLLPIMKVCFPSEFDGNTLVPCQVHTNMVPVMADISQSSFFTPQNISRECREVVDRSINIVDQYFNFRAFRRGDLNHHSGIWHEIFWEPLWHSLFSVKDESDYEKKFNSGEYLLWDGSMEGLLEIRNFIEYRKAKVRDPRLLSYLDLTDLKYWERDSTKS